MYTYILHVFVPPVKRPNLSDLQKGEYEFHKHENIKLVKYCSHWHDSNKKLLASFIANHGFLGGAPKAVWKNHKVPLKQIVFLPVLLYSVSILSIQYRHR